ncbi:DUF998 domain-containing protein [Cellulomonas shaoxiangyii]|uniref:DUF998 domain-containing protein n=1 Tax=Cellulomonas shaoxiangyii TaxID=2566013 RepID=UPI001AA0158C|nr:DUF998 domain-containing protein [Cellulomonas shaoxiangyii]
MRADDGGAVPAWAVASAVLAPVAMIGGWTLAAALQPGFDPVAGTISALAATTATAPAVMTAGLALTGAAHVGTALGTRPLPRAGRLLHALGGIATVAVAALPVDRAPQAHGLAAAVAFGALALWPAAAWRRGTTHGRTDVRPDRPAVTRPAVALTASAVLLALLTWFVLELQGVGPARGAWTGLSERAVAGAQALWPLAVVLSLRADAARRRSGTHP